MQQLEHQMQQEPGIQALHPNQGGLMRMSS
jgi:hypothetical protein